MDTALSPELEARLVHFAQSLIHQESAKVVIEPQRRASGFWFGGGNLLVDRDTWYLIGRYRNFGDSRTGLGVGERGLELALFVSHDQGHSFTKEFSWSKQQLSQCDREVLSIEGSALHKGPLGWELFVSTEKDGIGYPAEIAEYLKPGTGVWTIDSLRGRTLDDLAGSTVTPVVSSTTPEYLHVKDPFVATCSDGSLDLYYCTHPFCWTSSNTSRVTRSHDAGGFGPANDTFFPRGTTWDVAMTRGTCVLPIPAVGPFADVPVSLMFYDGGECVRSLEQHQAAVSRPRGYSCEELGGLAYFRSDQPGPLHRLSRLSPLFISPYGTGCSRYVDVCDTGSEFVATWQQGQQDGSQPLVMHRVTYEQAASILA